MRAKSTLLILIIAIIVGFAARATFQSSSAAKSRIEPSVPNPSTAAAPTGPRTDVGSRSDVDLRPLEIFYNVLRLVRDEYVEPIDKPQEKKMAYGSIRSMLDSLHDPLTRFLEPEQVEAYLGMNDGKFQGIGAVIQVVQTKQDGLVEEGLSVLSVVPGSPAERAGLKTGDSIVSINGKTILPYDPYQRVEKLLKDARTQQMPREKLIKILESENDRIKNGVSFQKALDMLYSNSSNELEISVKRAGANAPLTFKMNPTTTAVNPVSWWTPKPDIVCVKVRLLNKKAFTELEQAIQEFKQKGYRSMILDLRDSLGGSLEDTQSIAGFFEPGKTLTIVQLPKSKTKPIKAAAQPADRVWNGSLAVLVNSGTSGLSEVLAASLRDNQSAKIIGTKTAGQSLKQTFVELSDGSGITITTGKYLTSRSKDFKGIGLSADIAVTGNSEQIDKAVEILSKPKGGSV